MKGIGASQGGVLYEACSWAQGTRSPRTVWIETVPVCYCARDCAREGPYTTSRHPPSPYETMKNPL